MVDDAELFKVADAIVAEGKLPSQRLVRERLGRGSFSDIGPVFLSWCTARGFRPRPTAADLPKHLAERLATVAAEIWRDGHREGSIVAKNETERVVVERDNLKAALVEALAMLDGREKTIELLEMRVPVQAAKRSRQRSEKITFWKRVMEEIAALLKDRSLTAAQIIAEMSPVTIEKAKEADPTWCAANLADRMRGRVRNGKHFEEPEQGVFRRLGSSESPEPAT